MNESSNANDQGAQQGPPATHDEQAANSSEPVISGSDYEFAEPQLDAAEISDEVAESVDLKAAEAEAARVEEEARIAAQAVSPQPVVHSPEASTPTPADEAAEEPVDWDSAQTVMRTDFSQPPVANNPWSQAQAPSQEPEAPTVPPAPDLPPAPPIAPSAPDLPPAPEVPAAPEAPDLPAAPDAPTVPETPAAPAAAPHIGPGIADGHGWRRSETPWAQSATPWQPKSGQWQSPAQIARNEEEAAALLGAAATEAPGNAPEVTDVQSPDFQQPASPVAPSSHETQEQPSSPTASAHDPNAAQAPYGQAGAPAGQPPYGAPIQHGAPNYGPGGQGGAGVPPIPGYPGAPQGPGYPGGPQGPGYGGPQGPGGNGSGTSTKKLLIILGVVVVGLALIGFFIWLLVGFITGAAKNASPSPDTVEHSQIQESTSADNESPLADPSEGDTSDDGLILPALSPLKWLEGDCLRDFVNQSTEADVVLCSTPHNAQLVGTFYYGDTESYPGADALKAKASEVCDGVPFTAEAAAIKTLKQLTAYPSETTWNDQEDRRVDCLVQDTSGGNPLKTSLTK